MEFLFRCNSIKYNAFSFMNTNGLPFNMDSNTTTTGSIMVALDPVGPRTS